jgi:predicted transcriptional regulator of viral defense system
MKTAMERVLEHAGRHSVIRAKDLDGLGIPRNYLGRLTRAGKLEKIGRGLYSSPEASATEHRTLLEVCKKVPHAVVCLSSALRFHELTTENPFEVWIALKRGTWTPRAGYPPIRVVRFSGQSFDFGVAEYSVEGGNIRVYTPAKTVADCFKFKSKVGTDLAIQALRECFRQKKASMDELWTAAKVCRVANVMRPYMESLS